MKKVPKSRSLRKPSPKSKKTSEAELLPLVNKLPREIKQLILVGDLAIMGALQLDRE